MIKAANFSGKKILLISATRHLQGQASKTSGKSTLNISKCIVQLKVEFECIQGKDECVTYFYLKGREICGGMEVIEP